MEEKYKEEQTIFNLLHVMDQVTNKMFIRFQQESELSLGISHILVLLELHKKGEQRPSDLASTLGFTPASLTHLSTKLINNEYITLRNDENDRRTKYWSITPLGLDILNDAKYHGKNVRTELFSHLSEEDRQNLLEIYTKLYRTFI
ncbi:MarR family transcriptional regulator [Sporosarcina sp. PTS2304]|uniref:MarR family winged helix-turn-helix transcriptional regulator n=1 Tax=Sporosarcina sp. PTS2304 TaxID=2283194 RepID=UPI000E0D4FAA|nr:MarR family transcriptional regulator [Sporosarcina sp. PTS2304]AXH99259.1 MarR family transcriptional regulator [Sporosarcina sp. PTS2304]